MAQRNAVDRIADRPCRLDIILGLDRQSLAAGQPHKNRRRGNADGNHRIAQTRAQKGSQSNGQNEEGAGQHRVGETADQHIGPAAAIARDQAERHADQQRNANRDHACRQRGACSPDDAGEQIAPHLVGAHPVQPARCLAHQHVILLDRIIGCDQRRKHRHADQQNDDRQRDQCGWPRLQPPPRAGCRGFEGEGCRDGGAHAQSLSRGLTRI